MQKCKSELLLILILTCAHVHVHISVIHLIIQHNFLSNPYKSSNEYNVCFIQCKGSE
jgi:hypothetical protein